MKTLVGIFALALSLNAQAVGSQETLTCVETHSTDSRISHSLYGREIVLEKVGFDDLGDIYVGKDLSGRERIRSRLVASQNGFIFAGVSFAEVGPGKFEAKIDQLNGTFRYGTFSTTHTVQCILR